MHTATPDTGYHSLLFLSFSNFTRDQFQEIQERYNPDLWWLDDGWVGSSPWAGGQNLPIGIWAQEHRKINPMQCVFHHLSAMILQW